MLGPHVIRLLAAVKSTVLVTTDKADGLISANMVLFQRTRHINNPRPEDGSSRQEKRYISLWFEISNLSFTPFNFLACFYVFET